MVTFVPGRLPPHPEDTHPRLKLSPFLRGATPPPSVDWYSRLPLWPMYLNDRLGCCTIAMAGHEIENAAMYGQGETAILTDDAILTAYERVSGYNPADPSTDQGAVLQDVYGDWRKTGVGGHKALVFAQVDVKNLDEVKQAVDQFGAVGLGIVVTEGMMEAFDANAPWVAAGGAQLGGHAVPVVGYDAHFAYVVTWGRLQAMTWGCFEDATEEAWVAVLPEWFSAAGVDPEGLDLHGLGEAFAALTGEDNPFPAPQPTPPPPGPAPGPVVTADQVLATAARMWLSHHHVGANGAFAKQVQAWLTSKDLG